MSKKEIKRLTRNEARTSLTIVSRTLAFMKDASRSVALEPIRSPSRRSNVPSGIWPENHLRAPGPDDGAICEFVNCYGPRVRGCCGCRRRTAGSWSVCSRRSRRSLSSPHDGLAAGTTSRGGCHCRKAEFRRARMRTRDMGGPPAPLIHRVLFGPCAVQSD